MENKTKALLAVGGAALIGLSGLGGAAIHAANVEPITKIQYEQVVVEKEVPVEVPVEKVVEVEVDNGKLDLVLDHIYDNEGQIEYLTEDLDDDEVELIVDRIVFIDEIKKLAVDYVKKEGIDELDREVVNGTELDDRDIERFKVEDKSDEVIIDEVYFEDRDAEVLVEARFEQDDVDYKAVFRVEFEEGEVEDISVESIELR